jgi:hypothetical protein
MRQALASGLVPPSGPLAGSWFRIDWNRLGSRRPDRVELLLVEEQRQQAATWSSATVGLLDVSINDVCAGAYSATG